MINLMNHKATDQFSGKKDGVYRMLTKKQAYKQKRQKFIEELNRPIAYILDDVKETIVTENTYKPVTLNVLKRYFIPKGWF